MSVLKIKDKDGKWVGVTAIQGEKGEQGMSPKIIVNTNNSNTYKLRITTEDKDFITPNLKGGGGSGGGYIDQELGTIDNYCDFDGENIPPYNMDLPPLPMFRGGTRYAFETPVTMRIYNGTKDKNGNHDIDEYKTFESVYNEESELYEVDVPTLENGFLTDYLIYNPIPKKEWDTWVNPNILKILPVTSWKIHYEYKKNTFAILPNCQNSIYNSGEAYIYYNKYKNILGGAYQKAGDYGMAVYRREDFPFILDEPIQYWKFDSREKGYSNAIDISYGTPEWDNLMSGNTSFKVGEDYTVEGMNLGCCDPDSDYWGNSVLMDIAERIRDNNLLETREYDWVIADPSDIGNYFGEYGAKPLAPAMYVGLAKNHNYTIETTAGDCAIITPYNNSNKFITKTVKVQYPSKIVTAVVTKNDANSLAGATVGDATQGIGAGSVTGGTKLSNGTVMHWNTVDTSGDPDSMVEVPTALSCPNKYLKRGESFTFYVDDDADMYGIWVLCESEDDYKGIKIVEGVEPYSLLMEERMASGATKFNVKVFTSMFDRDDIKAEYNIKLSDNTTENDYCRLLNNNTIKHYDLDVFTMVGHEHSIDELSDKEEFVESLKVPKMRLSTATLIDGVSDLPENTFYFVYNE